MAAITNCHKLGGLKQCTFILSVWRSEVWHQLQGHTTCRSSFLAFSSFQNCIPGGPFLNLESQQHSICLQCHTAFPSIIKSPSPYMATEIAFRSPSRKFRIISRSLTQSYFSRIFLPCKVTFTGPGIRTRTSLGAIILSTGLGKLASVL